MQISDNSGLNILEKTACAAAGVAGVGIAKHKIQPQLVRPIVQYINKMPKPTEQQADLMIKTMLNDPIIKQTGIKPYLIDDKNFKMVAASIKRDSHKVFDKFFGNFAKKNPNFVKGFNQGYDELMQKLLNATKNGNQAFYHPVINSVVAPKSNPSLLTHELGHVKNAHMFKGAKPAIAAMRVCTLALAPAMIPAIAIWQACSNKNDKSFIKENAGKLTFAAFLPMIAEEAAASWHAIKSSIKCEMPKAVIQNQKKALGLALGTYGIVAAVSGLAVAGVTKLASMYTAARKS